MVRSKRRLRFGDYPLVSRGKPTSSKEVLKRYVVVPYSKGLSEDLLLRAEVYICAARARIVTSELKDK
jgi:hypothetical protein